jgi:putative transposase
MSCRPCRPGPPRPLPRGPWRDPFVERVIGSVRREWQDHVIDLDERHLRRVLRDYFEHYLRWR